MSRYSKLVKKRKKKNKSFLSDKSQAFIARRIIDFTGITLILFGLALFLSLYSYTHSDPSLNTASIDDSQSINNWLGLPGAYASDMIIQTIGAAGFALACGFFSWGIRIYKRIGISKIGLRVLLLLISTLSVAIALAIAPSGDFITHPYLGGSLGTLIIDKSTSFFPNTPHIELFISVIFGISAIVLLPIALAFRKEEILSFLNRINAAVILCITAISSFIINSYEWVVHYGDPSFLPKEKKVKVKTKNILKKPKLKVDSSPTKQAQVVEKTEETHSHDKIKVFTPKGPETKVTQKTLPLSEHCEWKLPGLELLQDAPTLDGLEEVDERSLRQNAELLQNVLADFKVQGDIVSIHPGPVITLYELEPAPGVKTSRVISLSDDIARAMAAVSVRCELIAGSNVIGIELPNRNRQTVYLKELMESKETQNSSSKLPLVLGKNIGGKPVVADLSKMPHLLVAGTTGSGKSVAVNTMIVSLLYRLPPEKCRFIMIDPKMLELSVYDDIPHLLSPVVTEPGKAVMSLKWAVQEMENRYKSMSSLGVRNIEGYNERLREAHKKGETLMNRVQTGFDSETGKPVFEEQPLDMTELPYIVIVIDEFADLMVVAKKDIENAVQRLAQMARAAGIHLIMATQRPSVDVITGVIKANFPTRISFQVTSQADSRTILNQSGAEQLLGLGDMLYMAGGGRLTRVHGPFVSDEEVENVVDFLKSQGNPSYIEEVTQGVDLNNSEVMAAMFGGGVGENKVDELYDQAVALVAREGKASTSFIQRCLQIGYNRAARIIEEMERQGVVSKATPTGKRDVLVQDFSDA